MRNVRTLTFCFRKFVTCVVAFILLCLTKSVTVALQG